MDKTIFEHIDRARKFNGTVTGLNESARAVAQQDRTAMALRTAEHLREAVQQATPVPAQMTAMPVSN